jgi:hypothetical protein
VTAPVHVTLPLPALSVLTGRSLAPGYCPACLDHFYGRGPAQPEAERIAAMHDGCRKLLEAIRDAQPEPVECAA